MKDILYVGDFVVTKKCDFIYRSDSKQVISVNKIHVSAD